MAENQIEKLVVQGRDGTVEPVPIATTNSPGIASFDSSDFTVSSTGVVNVLTKYGLSFTAEANSSDETGNVYKVIAPIGRQFLKSGDVGIVTEDINATETSLGDIVQILQIVVPSGPDTYFYGKVLGSIRGPQGETGATGPIGPIGPKGDAGTSYFTAEPMSADASASSIEWDITNTLEGDYIISSQSTIVDTVAVQRGDIFKVILINSDGHAVTITTPTISVSQFQLGIWGVSGAVVDGNTITWNYSPSLYEDNNTKVLNDTKPLIGNYALCIDDSDALHFGKIYVITGVKEPTLSETQGTVTTSTTGANLVADAKSISIGNVTTIPNTATGDAGQATASFTQTQLDAKLNLGIPQGAKGAQGIQGPKGEKGEKGEAGVANVNAKGNYNATETYNLNDLVYFNSTLIPTSFKAGSYICTKNGTIGKVPGDKYTNEQSEETDYWGFFVAEGAQGPQGPQGPVGPQGPQGDTGIQGEDGLPGGIHVVLPATLVSNDVSATIEADASYANPHTGYLTGQSILVLISEPNDNYPNLFKRGDLVSATLNNISFGTTTHVRLSNCQVIGSIKGLDAPYIVSVEVIDG